MSIKKSALVAVLAFASSVTLIERSASGAQDWSGFYVGLHAGGAYFDADVGPGSLSPPGTPGSSFDGDGGLFGVLGGYNFQQGNFVFGIEGDISLGSISGENATLTIPDLEIDRLATLRARAGFLINNNVLLYGTVGVGVAEADSVETHTNTLGSSGSHTGVIAGIGAEYAVNDNVTVRAEYLHGDFDDDRYSFPEDALHSHDIEFNTDVVRVGLIWTLN